MLIFDRRHDSHAIRRRFRGRGLSRQLAPGRSGFLCCGLDQPTLLFDRPEDDLFVDQRPTACSDGSNSLPMLKKRDSWPFQTPARHRHIAAAVRLEHKYLRQITRITTDQEGPATISIRYPRTQNI